jgi:hypothetical protein
MKNQSLFLSCLIFGAFALTGVLRAQVSGEYALQANVRETLKKNSEILRFIENKGQFDNPDALYYLTSKQGTVIIEKGRLRFIAKERVLLKKGDLAGNVLLKEDETIETGQHSFSMYFEGASDGPEVMLGDRFSTKYNYYIGEDTSKWRSGVRAAKELILKNVYEGVDLRIYSSEDGNMEFDWVLAAGVTADRIKLRFSGQDNLRIDRDGNLSVGLRFSDVKFNIPECYQVTPEGKRLVDFSFTKSSNDIIGLHADQAIDANYPTVIDPVLSWGTFMDGNDPDFDQYLFAVQVDPDNGMVYCAGASNRNIPTNSPPYDADGYLNSINGFGTGATPRVAVVYRVNSTGSDLVDLTLYGPGSVSGSATIVAYALSLSTNRVFIGGRTTLSGLPMTGSPFDNSFSSNDGFVAVFSRDLSTLHYSTYLGSSGSEDLGVTSIRALDDNSFICGLTAAGSLPASYISAGAAQTSFGGSQDMYIAKFSSLNTLSWGTYIGGSGNEIFNDLELFGDGRVAFAGSGTGSLTEKNSAASRSTGSDFDGILGVLNSGGTAFNYLDEVGGGQDDKINDLVIKGTSLFWTGIAGSGFPTASGAYDVSHNGGTDAIVGSVSEVGGSGSWRATYFGGSGNDLGSGIQRVEQTKCDGSVEGFLLVFGTCEAGIPTKNINGDPFFDATNNGGLDMFFAGFDDDVTALQYATNIGGQYNDYLGDTGEPRGGNHLWVKGANIYVGTTTHSASHSPTIVGNTGFDKGKTNNANPTSDDTHVLFSIQFSSLVETDYSDAPSTYGAPSHTLDCIKLGIGSIDAETAANPGADANGDDNAGLDDEDGISTFPIFKPGGPQNISLTVNGIYNSTGLTAKLYAWIDLNGDGNFDSPEFVSVSVANGFSGSKTLTWSNVTIDGSPDKIYLRIRLTTNALVDDGNTSNLDERSVEAAENGEVEDYSLCVKPSAGPDVYLNCVAQFPGGTANMSASGSGTWSAASGNPGTAIISNPNSPTTTIYDFSQEGVYSFIWKYNLGCFKDTARIIVTAKPYAGTDKSVDCVPSFPGGSVAMGATGSGTWTPEVGNPGTAVIVSPNLATTIIKDFSTIGNYSFIWTNASGCSDTTIVEVTNKPDGGPDKQANCVLSFPGGSVTMEAKGAGAWIAHAGNPSATIVTPNSPTSVIKDFASEGNYKFVWKDANNCSDTVSVVVTSGPVGSAAPVTICSGENGAVPLSSNVAGTSFTWTAAQFSGATITGFSNCNSSCGTSISQTLTNTSTSIPGVVRYNVTPKAPNGCVGSTFTVDVTVNPSPVAAASGESICSGNSTSILLSSTVSGSTFAWTASQLSGAAITGFSNCASSCGSTISQILTNTSNAVSGVVRYSIIPTSPQGCPGQALNVDVTVKPKPLGSASPQTICSGQSTAVTLSSTLANTTFTWSAAQYSGASISGFGDCLSSCGNVIGQILTNSSSTAAGVIRYTVIPKSSQNCLGNSFTVDVTVNPKPVVSVATTPACIGISNGSVEAIVSGGKSPYDYSWSNGSSLQSQTNLPSGIYTVTVTDDNSCTNNAQGTIISQGISSMTATPGPCDPASNTYSLSGVISLVNPPLSGSLTVSVGVKQQILLAPFSSPVNYSIVGLAADGGAHTVNAVFSDGAKCSASVNYTAPANCQPVISHNKTFVSATDLGFNLYSIIYSISVSNNGGNGFYDLVDAPIFDSDFSIQSASYTSSAPGNAGSALAGSGPWSLANDQAITSGATHNYVLTIIAKLDLSPASGGDNLYKKCGTTSPGTPKPNEGLYNESRLDVDNDGVADEVKWACGDVPYVTVDKSIATITDLGGNMYEVSYQVLVKNTGGASADYDLKDSPGFDDDIAINSASYTSNAAGNPGGALVGSGPWTLANNQVIAAGATHTYTLKVKVTLDLSAGSSGDNVYSKCEKTTPGDPASGEGLYNKASIDTNDDGQPDDEDEACGDLPNITVSKTVVSITDLGGNMYEVSYQVLVKNTGGASGDYDLKDSPGFDDDIAINSASYTSTAAGNPGGALVGSGPWTLANNQVIAAGATHTYTLKVKVTLDLSAGSSGDNVYSKCEKATPGDPKAGEGLYNKASVDTNDDGQPEDEDEACGDLPNITVSKTVVSITDLGGNMYEVSYQVLVKNTGGASGDYDLKDSPGFDDDIAINSASYTSNAAGNPGGALVGSGPWTLANNQVIAAGATHTYTLKVKVTLDLSAGSSGDNVYSKCEKTTPGDPKAGEGLYNKASVDTNDDGQPEDEDEACGDLPNITVSKTVVSITDLGGNMYEVSYQVLVKNTGGASGDYDLKDSPGFDDDIAINSASYTSNAAGNPGGALVGSGPWTLANNQVIATGATHTYTIKVKVTLDLSAGSSGDNVYSKCEKTTPGDPKAGEGLYNKASVDTNDDGQPDDEDEACGDLPNITVDKSIATITDLGGNMYEVSYQVLVKNTGGASADYDLKDSPGFDDDIAINSASYTSTAAGNPGGALVGSGPWTLANNQVIAAGATHTYTIKVKVTLDLSAGSSGDNVYSKCEKTTPGDPKAGEGLYNKASIDTNDDGQPEDEDEACGDLPNITVSKTVVSVTDLGGNMYEVSYQIVVNNGGGASGDYDLKDSPGFDDDIAINSASYTSNAAGNPGGALVGSGPWTLANNQVIATGATHTYTIKVKVTLDLSAGSSGDNVYSKCEKTTPGDPKAGEGLYNKASVDTNDDGQPDDEDEACGDLPNITVDKSIATITDLGGNMYEVSYQVLVKNTGGASGDYDLKDSPGFDDDIAINSASYTSNAAGNPGGALVGSGPWTLANNQVIAAGATHTYTIKVKVTLDLSAGSSGDNVYSKCEKTTPGDPKAGEGLYNKASIDTNDDGQPEDEDEACGDLPNITVSKTVVSVTDLGGNMYEVSYQVLVKNTGGASGDYDLKDSPGFDDDIAINSASYTSNAAGNPGGALAGSGPWTLANNQAIAAGATHTYTVKVKVTLNLSAGSNGDNVYSKCGKTTPGDPTSGEGLYNKASIDTNDDGQPEDEDEACADLPNITVSKSVANITDLGGNMYEVSYQVLVKNTGGASGDYDLKDSPGFDDDIAINSASYTSMLRAIPEEHWWEVDRGLWRTTR